MHYEIAVCDDSAADAQYIKALVCEWAQLRLHTAEVRCFASSEAFLFEYEENKSYDILLLDIEMGGMDGVELARGLRRENDAVQIIFITGYSSYILEGYEVAALNYLMKPVKREKLFDTLERAARKIHKNERALLLTSAEGMVRLPLYEIRYLEVRQNYVTIHAKSDCTVKRTLSELDERFCRMGRSYIVNLCYIGRITKAEDCPCEGFVQGCTVHCARRADGGAGSYSRGGGIYEL